MNYPSTEYEAVDLYDATPATDKVVEVAVENASPGLQAENDTPAESNVSPASKSEQVLPIRVSELISSASPERISKIEKVMTDIIELAQSQTIAGNESVAEAPVLQKKLELLARELSLEYKELVEILIFSDDQTLILDQEVLDILYGLRKELSMEHSFEFFQSSNHGVSGSNNFPQSLGQFILSFLARGHQAKVLPRSVASA